MHVLWNLRQFFESVVLHALQAAQCQGEDLAYFHQSRDALMLQVKMQCGKIADERKLKNDLNK